jgi:uncharacterized protein (DUF924 family)
LVRAQALQPWIEEKELELVLMWVVDQLPRVAAQEFRRLKAILLWTLLP